MGLPPDQDESRAAERARRARTAPVHPRHRHEQRPGRAGARCTRWQSARVAGQPHTPRAPSARRKSSLAWAPNRPDWFGAVDDVFSGELATPAYPTPQQMEAHVTGLTLGSLLSDDDDDDDTELPDISARAPGQAQARRASPVAEAGRGVADARQAVIMMPAVARAAPNAGACSSSSAPAIVSLVADAAPGSGGEPSARFPRMMPRPGGSAGAGGRSASGPRAARARPPGDRPYLDYLDADGGRTAALQRAPHSGAMVFRAMPPLDLSMIRLAELPPAKSRRPSSAKLDAGTQQQMTQQWNMAIKAADSVWVDEKRRAMRIKAKSLWARSAQLLESKTGIQIGKALQTQKETSGKTAAIYEVSLKVVDWNLKMEMISYECVLNAVHDAIYETVMHKLIAQDEVEQAEAEAELLAGATGDYIMRHRLYPADHHALIINTDGACWTLWITPCTDGFQIDGFEGRVFPSLDAILAAMVTSPSSPAAASRGEPAKADDARADLLQQIRAQLMPDDSAGFQLFLHEDARSEVAVTRRIETSKRKKLNARRHFRAAGQHLRLVSSKSMTLKSGGLWMGENRGEYIERRKQAVKERLKARMRRAGHDMAVNLRRELGVLRHIEEERRARLLQRRAELKAKRQETVLARQRRADRTRQNAMQYFAARPANAGPMTRKEMLSFRKLINAHRNDFSTILAPPTEQENVLLVAQQKRYDALLVKESVALKAGFRSPHIVILCNKWKHAGAGVCSPGAVQRVAHAAHKVSPRDSHPIRLVVYDYAMSSAELLQQIRAAITGGAADGSPASYLLARSMTFMVHEEVGTFYFVDGHPTSAANLLMPSEALAADKTLQIVDEFWVQIDSMLSCHADDPVLSDFSNGDRSECRLYFLGLYLEATIDGSVLSDVLASRTQCDVYSALEQTREGQSIIETFFDWERFKKARALLENEIRQTTLGYDDMLDVKMAEKWGKGGAVDMEEDKLNAMRKSQGASARQIRHQEKRVRRASQMTLGSYELGFHGDYDGISEGEESSDSAAEDAKPATAWSIRQESDIYLPQRCGDSALADSGDEAWEPEAHDHRSIAAAPAAKAAPVSNAAEMAPGAAIAGPSSHLAGDDGPAAKPLPDAKKWRKNLSALSEK